MSTRAVAFWVAATASVQALLPAPAFPQKRAFDLDTGNAPHEVVIPAALPPLLATVASSDASLVLHMTVQISNGWFDAIARRTARSARVYTFVDRHIRGAVEALR